MALVHLVRVFLANLLFDLSNTCGEENAFELFKHGVNLLLTVFKVLANLNLLDVSPLTSLPCLVLFEVVIELSQQVLVSILLEDVLELFEAVLMCLSLTPAQKVKNFFPFHSKAALEDVLKILIVGTDLLDI